MRPGHGALERTRTSTPLPGQPLKLLRIPFRHEGQFAAYRAQYIAPLVYYLAATMSRYRAPSAIIFPQRYGSRKRYSYWGGPEMAEIELSFIERTTYLEHMLVRYRDAGSLERGDAPGRGSGETVRWVLAEDNS